MKFLFKFLRWANLVLPLDSIDYWVRAYEDGVLTGEEKKKGVLAALEDIWTISDVVPIQWTKVEPWFSRVVDRIVRVKNDTRVFAHGED